MLKARLNSEDTDRLVRPLAALGLSPNVWTAISILPALAGLVMLYQQQLLAGLVLFIASGLIDMIDGAVARAMDLATTRGAFIDGVVDRYVEMLLYLGLYFYLGNWELFYLPGEVWFLLLVFGAVMTSFVRAYADHRGLIKDPAELKKMGGLLERGERLLLLYAGMVLGIFNTSWLMLAIAATALLANLTVLQRIAFAVRKGGA
jgi:archaetidylinositol phosphate synthase